MDERSERLGYVPQKELVYNKNLPYSDGLDEESEQFFSEIKTNLAKSVLLHEVTPGVIHWLTNLSRYLRLYGRKFSKADHIHLIKLLYKLVTVPELELKVVQHVAHLLNLLLKKKKLLSRDDLVLPWRPLYELYEKALCSQYERIGMLLLPVNLEAALKSVIQACRLYFSVESTREMLEEWYPLICPFDTSMSKAMNYLELFLPVCLPPEQHHNGFKLWMDDLMKMWQSCPNMFAWENRGSWICKSNLQHLVGLFTRLARNNIGYIDWEPYIPMIFTRLLYSFHLPGTVNKVQIPQPRRGFETNAIVIWIASMLGGKSSCQKHITQLFKAIESYYHPSNNGIWAMKLQRLLYRLPAAVVRRINIERYAEPTWETEIPSSHKLTDAEITEFVQSMKGVVLLSMFSKGGSGHCALALQNLAMLRPELVIPPIIERLYSSLETLTEPHCLIAAMQCIVSVARPLVRGGKYFPEGPSHVIPLLIGSLPGIDANDIKKCMVTFQFISTFVTLITLVDCTKATSCRTDLTESEQELCLSTVQFEDFVLQFMDRCFAVIENNSLESPTKLDRETELMNPEENILEVCLSSTFSSILTQCSPEIFESALKKLRSFVTSHVLETRVSGKYAANMCRSTCKVNPELALKVFLPHFSKIILNITSSEDITKEETLDNELLFSLLLLSEIVRCHGQPVLHYKTELKNVLHSTVGLQLRQGYLLSGALLRSILKRMTSVYPLDYRNTYIPWEQCLNFSEHLPIRDWGRPGNIHNLGIDWHVPSKEEIEYVQDLLDTFLRPELKNLQQWADGKTTMTREDLQRSLNLVLDALLGAGCVLPMWEGEPRNLTESSVPLYCTRVKEVGSVDVDFKDGKNVRQEIAEVLQAVLGHIMQSSEDDTKSLFLVIRIYRSLMFYWGVSKDDFDNRWKGFHVVKKSLENKLIGSKQHIRTLLVDRTLLQHELRVMERNKTIFTPIHQKLTTNLLELSTSHYSEVRTKAQEVLQLCLRSFPHCYQMFLPKFLTFLQKNDSVSHEQFKGALYILLGYRHHSLLTIHDWEAMKQVWPAIINAPHSEKLSIIKLLDEISTHIVNFSETIQLRLEIPNDLLDEAKKVWPGNVPLPNGTCPSEDEIKLASKALEERSKKNECNYLELINCLVGQVQNGNLHWRHYNMAKTFLSLLVRYDIPLPSSAVHLFVQHLVYDILEVRQVAIGAMCAILKQQKRPHPTFELDLSSIDVSNIPLHSSLPKVHDNNIWLQYNSLTLPRTKEKWEKAIFIHKTNIGFYQFPKPLLVYSPDSQQPSLDRSRDELSEVEKSIYDAFTNQEFVDKLISYLSLEERKGYDKFDSHKCYMFESLFRNFGDAFLPYFKDHLEKLVSDLQESHQRCATEIIAAMIRGSKHWNFEKTNNLQKVLIPILKSALNNITPETMKDWGTCFATACCNRDPNKIYWVFELLIDNPLKGENGSFLESSWLYALLGALNQQEWRCFELFHRLLNYLKPHLTHSYQNVREKIGSLIGTIFMCDINFPKSTCLQMTPKKAPFIQEILTKLTILNIEENVDSPTEENTSLSGTTQELSNLKLSASECSANHKIDSKSKEKKEALNLLRTVCRWLMINLPKVPHAASPEIFKLLPTLCLMQSDTTDDELQTDCTYAINALGNTLLLPESLQVSIETVKQITSSSSWHARATALSFLQHIVFSNLFNVMQHSSWVDDIKHLILDLLQDEQVEVREVAGETLSGLLHCEFIKLDEELLKHFRSKCRRKLKRHKERIMNCTVSRPSYDTGDIIECHAGVLGLCACVNAYPYDVPIFLPEILVLLADHLNDPQPISGSIKKTLSNFRRTHYDNWRDHKLKFTEDQLAIITDLLVSPNYYA